jgi:colanic acid/amylovoran biosynthesis protein
MADRSASPRRRRICIVGASFSTGNLGVSALATGAVSAVVNAFPEAEVLLVDYAKEPSKRKVRTADGEIVVETMNIRFSKKAYLRNNIALLLLLAALARIMPVPAIAKKILASNDSLKRISDADLVLSLAGGDSFSDIYGFGRLLYVALPQVLALLLKRPLILLPQTLGPFKGRCARMVASGIMNRASAIYSRDHQSIQAAERELKIPADRLKFAYDMAFAMEPVAPARTLGEAFPDRRKGQTVVGLNISGLLMIGGYTRNNMFGLTCDYRDLTNKIVAGLLRNEDVRIVLVPHVLGEGEESDTAACVRFYDELDPILQKRVQVIREAYDQQETKFLIGQCDFFIGARMHACIAAISQAVPAVCLAYSRKFIGVMEGIEQADLVVDLEKQDSTGAVAAIMHLFGIRDTLRQRIRNAMPRVKASVLNLLKSAGKADSIESPAPLVLPAAQQLRPPTPTE